MLSTNWNPVISQKQILGTSSCYMELILLIFSLKIHTKIFISLLLAAGCYTRKIKWLPKQIVLPYLAVQPPKLVSLWPLYDVTNNCTPVSDTVFCQRLRSASSHQVSVPRYRLSSSTYVHGRRAFSVAGPTVWNSLPEDNRDPECSVDSYSHWRHFYFRSTSMYLILDSVSMFPGAKRRSRILAAGRHRLL